MDGAVYRVSLLSVSLQIVDMAPEERAIGQLVVTNLDNGGGRWVEGGGERCSTG